MKKNDYPMLLPKLKTMFKLYPEELIIKIVFAKFKLIPLSRVSCEFNNFTLLGLEPSDAGFLAYYFHFRAGYDVSLNSIQNRINKFDETIDIFESIDNDEPKRNHVHSSFVFY